MLSIILISVFSAVMSYYVCPVTIADMWPPEPGVWPRLHHHGASLWPGLGRVEWRRTLPWQHLRPRVTSRDSKEISELPLPYKISCIVSSEIPLISLVTSHSSWSQPQQILHVRFAQKTDAWCSGGGECTGGQKYISLDILTKFMSRSQWSRDDVRSPGRGDLWTHH